MQFMYINCLIASMHQNLQQNGGRYI